MENAPDYTRDYIAGIQACTASADDSIAANPRQDAIDVAHECIDSATQALDDIAVVVDAAKRRTYHYMAENDDMRAIQSLLNVIERLINDAIDCMEDATGSIDKLEDFLW